MNITDIIKDYFCDSKAVTKLISAFKPMKITVEASVFQCSQDSYAIIWATNRKGSGKVTYTYEGVDYTVNDSTLGNINTLETVHTVVVPKKHLDGNTYRYHSQHIVAKGGYHAIKGGTVSSAPVSFKGYNGQKKINVLSISDVHNNLPPAEGAAKGLGEKADLVVLNGDISSTLVTKKDFVSSVLVTANRFSKGEIPVAYNRGNHETRGQFAPRICRYFPYMTGGLYFAFSYGPLWALVLDSGEDKEDSHVEYSGLVDFENYIAQETRWLRSLPTDSAKDSVFAVAFSHIPDIRPLHSCDWQAELERLGVQLLVAGHTHKLEIDSDYNKSASFKTVVSGGKNSNEKINFIASMFTFDVAEKKVSLVSCSTYGEKLADIQIQL